MRESKGLVRLQVQVVKEDGLVSLEGDVLVMYPPLCEAYYKHASSVDPDEAASHACWQHAKRAEDEEFFPLSPSQGSRKQDGEESR